MENILKLTTAYEPIVYLPHALINEGRTENAFFACEVVFPSSFLVEDTHNLTPQVSPSTQSYVLFVMKIKRQVQVGGWNRGRMDRIQYNGIRLNY